MKDNKKSVTLGSMRIPFLVLPPTCVGLGVASAVYTGSTLINDRSVYHPQVVRRCALYSF